MRYLTTALVIAALAVGTVRGADEDKPVKLPAVKTAAHRPSHTDLRYTSAHGGGGKAHSVSKPTKQSHPAKSAGGRRK